MNRKPCHILPTQRHLVATCLALGTGAALCSAQLAFAQNNPNDRVAADVLFEEGKALLKADNWQSACEKFQLSLALDPSASTYIKTARCHEHAGHLKAALADYSKALELVRSKNKDNKHARDLEAVAKAATVSIESRLGHLRVQVSPKTNPINLAIDGELVDSAAQSGPISVDPGSHTITVTAPGFHLDPAQVTLAEGQSREITLELLADSAQASPLAIAPSRPEPAPLTTAQPSPAKPAESLALPQSSAAQPAPGRSQRAIGYVAGSSGVLLLGAAAYFGIRTASLVHQARSDNGIDGKPHCDSNMACDAEGLRLIGEAGKAQSTAFAFTAAGAAFAGLGIVLLATAPSRKQAAPALQGRLTLSVSPWNTTLGGSF